MAPVPVTLEATIRVDSDSRQHFVVGSIINTYSGYELEIIKSKSSGSGNVQGGQQAEFTTFIAVLRCVREITYVKTRAIIKANVALSEVYRSTGAKLKGIQGDFPVSRFVCLAGEVPSYHIARALQEGGGVVRWKNGRLEFMPLRGLFAQKPSTTISGATEDVQSGFLERHEIPFFYSLDADGAFVYGNRAKERSARFQPGISEMALRNMTSCLVLTKTAQVKYDEKLAAGDIAEIPGSDPLVIMTGATLFAAGVDGDPPEQSTQLWLGRLES
ncbi:MAG: hypothetical protein ACRER3_17945 [Pseudomonas fluorescens]